MSISSDYLHCRRCNTRVAFKEDYIVTIEQGVIFNRVFNVEVSDAMNNHQTLYENTIANAYCGQCGALLGGEFIAVLQQDMHVREGRFLMNLSKLILRANEDNADQDGDADEKDLGTNGENVDQDGDTTEKNGDASDQYGDTTEQNANQALGTNKQKCDQDGDANEQVPKEQNVGANEQNADQDGGGNEQHDDEDGGQTIKRMKI